MFGLIDSDNNRKITKKEMQNYTQMIAQSATPDRPWDQAGFDRGFAKLDKEGLGYCEYE